MTKVKFFAAFLLICLIFTFSAPFAGAIDDLPDITAKSVIIVDPESGEVVFEKAADERRDIASLTKIMTALIVMEEANMDDIATVSYEALADLDPDSSIADLRVGEEMRVEDLLKCVLVQSANDACNVLAEHLYGSTAAFVAEMNRRAEALGCSNTHFMNAHGLTETGHYSTARDLYTIILEAMKHPQFMEICNTARVEIPATNLKEARVYLSTNYLISAQKVPNYVYYYAKGIKTGHTSAAGYCLASTAEKDNQLYICVVLGSERTESGDSTRIGSFDDTKALYEWAFANFSYQTVLAKNIAVAELPVSLSSEVDYVTLVPNNSIEALLPNDFNPEEVKLDLHLDSPEGVEAPVEKGQKLGTATVMWNGHDYGEVELVALGEASLDKTLLYVQNVKDFFAKPWVMWVGIGIGALIVIYIIFLIVINSKRRRRRAASNYRGSSRNRRRRY